MFQPFVSSRAKAKSKRADMGKDVESTVRDWLEARSVANHGFAYHRYPDARSARGSLAAQPADFLVAEQHLEGGMKIVRRAWHLEAKDTEQERKLPKSKVGQFGKLKLFHWAGIEPVVLVYRSKLQDWVFLTSADFMNYEECPPSFPLTGLTSYASAELALTEIFK